MVELKAFLRVLEQNPAAFHEITLENHMKSVYYAGKLKNNILIVQPAEHHPYNCPIIYPVALKSFSIELVVWLMSRSPNAGQL
jgi:hypothetical protein